MTIDTLQAGYTAATDTRQWIETDILADLERKEFRGIPLTYPELYDLLRAIAAELPEEK